MMDDPLIYCAFGDSITTGNNVRKDMRFPKVLSGILAHHTQHPILIRNYGKNGLASSGLLKMLHMPHVRRAIRHAHFTSVCIGGDDLIYAYVKWRLFRNPLFLDEGIEKFGHNFDRICHLLTTYHPGRIVLSTFYNPFPRTPLAVKSIEYCNDGIIRPLAARYGFPVADLYAAFRGQEPFLLQHFQNGLLEEYRPFTPRSPIHPNEQGYRLIARCFAERML